MTDLPPTPDIGTLTATVTGEIPPVTEASVTAQKAAAFHKAGEESLRSEGQRHINLIWESTQSKISVAVVFTALFVSGLLSLLALYPNATERQMAMAITAFMLVSNLATGIIGFYFGRTNHQRTGGVPAGEQEGR